MASPVVDSPYPVGSLVRDPELLQLRRWEIDRALELAAPEEDGDHRHAMVMGEPHSGRSSVLAEISRRAEGERKRLVVHLHGGEGGTLCREEIIRRLLTGIAEAVSRLADGDTDWYQSWQNRVYLRDTSPVNEHDALSSALIFAADLDGKIDRAVLERDLSALADIARRSEIRGIVVCIDDASPLTEDVALTEEMVEVFDSVGYYSLLMAGLPTVAGHFTEAASRCLERLTPVWLEAFFSPHQISTALAAPLQDRSEHVEVDDLAFLLDLLSLTAGNPYELMVVAHYLWLSCERGEQETYALTPRLLDRVIPHLSLRTTDGGALRDGAQAIDRLPDEQVQGAVELAGLSRLTIREVAISRLLKDASGRGVPADRKPEDVTDHELEEIEQVKADLADLEERGVVQLHTDDERFSIVGGRPAAVLLKYKARARIGSSPERPYGLNFLQAVGQPLARNLALKALSGIPGATSLGYTVTGSDRGTGSRSPRPALRSLTATGDITRLISSEAEVSPWNGDAFDRIANLVADDDARIALICTSLTYGRGEFEYMELWQIPAQVSDQEVSQALGEVSETWQPLVGASQLSWRGIESAVVSGEVARKTLCVLHPFVSTKAVIGLFEAWMEEKDATTLSRAIRACQEAVAVMQAGHHTDLEFGGELSGTLSRLGFFQSFEDDCLAEARSTLEEAQRTGEADTWVTDWNLANVLAREGEAAGALDYLDQAIIHYTPITGSASILFYVPGRAAVECLVGIGDGGVRPLLYLQRAVIEGNRNTCMEAIKLAKESADKGAAQAAEWVESEVSQPAFDTDATPARTQARGRVEPV